MATIEFLDDERTKLWAEIASLKERLESAGLGSFKTKAEAENFYAYCKTYLVRFLFLMTEGSLTSLAKKVPDVLDYTKSNKLLDFSKDLNKQLYTLCNLTAAEVKYIEKTIIDMDASRSRRKV